MPAWQHPFLWAAAGLALGLYLHELPLAWALAGQAVLTMGAAYLWWVQQAPRLVWVLPVFSALGVFRAEVSQLSRQDPLLPLRGHLVQLQGYLIEEPLPTRKACRLLVRVDSVYGPLFARGWRLTGECIIYVRGGCEGSLKPGTRVQATLRLDTLQYGAAYWARQGVHLGGFAPHIQIGEVEPTYGWGYFLRLRQVLLEGLRRTAPRQDPVEAVLEALLLGYRRGVDPETRAAFQLSGAAHILAVSGMHVGLVLTLWLFLLRHLPGGWAFHPVSQGALLILVLLYGLLTGASPSAMRAVIMGAVALLARMAYKPYLALNALGFAAFIQLSLDPALLHNVGFQLSYAAVGGILAFYGPLRGLFRGRFFSTAWGAYLRDLVAISLAAQAGTLLLSWAYFGRLPLYFLLTNLVAVPLGTAATFAAVGWLMLMPFPGLGSLAAWPAYGLAWLMVQAVKGLSRLPGSSLELPPLPLPWAVGLTLLLVAGGGWALHRLRREETLWIA
ncbi:MAG: hypothetical protein KatS3mg026_0393 [Bacteroidia bacterium]|nr:MAG: hypothetical protein KatS3mg026_0393 [Bacteroidia bacterium]